MFFAEKEFMKTIKENASFKELFKWRSELAFVAILAIAILHFAFQFSFIRSENSENSRAAEFPVKIEQPLPQVVEIKPAEIEAKKQFETKKITSVKPPKSVVPIRQQRTEAAPSKPLLKKKVPVESRAARLRRAERILTGV
jgi:hypothetical protein